MLSYSVIDFAVNDTQTDLCQLWSGCTNVRESSLILYFVQIYCKTVFRGAPQSTSYIAGNVVFKNVVKFKSVLFNYEFKHIVLKAYVIVRISKDQYSPPKVIGQTKP